MPRTKKQPDFEASLERLEKIVDTLEEGELSLEESLKIFEEGVSLTRSCQKALDEAEQRVKQLSINNGVAELVDSDEDLDPDDIIESDIDE